MDEKIKNKLVTSKLLLITIGIFILISIIFIVSYVYGNKENNSSSTIDIDNTFTKDLTDNQTGYKTFTNNEIGFSFQYPQDVPVYETTEAYKNETFSKSRLYITWDVETMMPQTEGYCPGYYSNFSGEIEKLERGEFSICTNSYQKSEKIIMVKPNIPAMDYMSFTSGMDCSEPGSFKRMLIVYKGEQYRINIYIRANYDEMLKF